MKLVRNAIKSKFIYNGWENEFDGKGSWSFGNDFARNVVIFGVDNSSSSHTDNRKNDFLVLVEGQADGIHDNTGAAEKKFRINFSKEKIKLHYHGDESCLHVSKTEFSNLRRMIT